MQQVLPADGTGGRPNAATTSAGDVIQARDLSLVFETADGPVHALQDIELHALCQGRLPCRCIHKRRRKDIRRGAADLH